MEEVLASPLVGSEGIIVAKRNLQRHATDFPEGGSRFGRRASGRAT